MTMVRLDTAPEQARRLSRLRSTLTRWAKTDGRGYPWRQSNDAFLRLVAEVLLQRTRADAVAEVWPAVVREFPTPQKLATATDEQIAATIRSLGLLGKRRGYLRALGEALATMDSIPRDPDALAALPGVGPYSAAAFLAGLEGQRTAPVDANVRRVLGRVVLGEDRADIRTARELAARLLSHGDPGTVLHALLDFGAGPCKPVRPTCKTCPAQRFCQLHQGSRPTLSVEMA
jgi:A/G-specific adenine glycosylase